MPDERAMTAVKTAQCFLSNAAVQIARRRTIIEMNGKLTKLAEKDAIYE